MRALATSAATKVVKHMSEKKMIRIEQPFRYPREEDRRTLNVWAQGPVHQLESKEVKDSDGNNDHIDYGYNWLKGYTPYSMTTPFFNPKTINCYNIMDWICNKPTEEVFLNHGSHTASNADTKTHTVQNLPQWGYGTREGRQVNVTSIVFEGYFRGNAGRFYRNGGDSDIYATSAFPTFYNIVPKSMGTKPTAYRFVVFETYQPLKIHLKSTLDFDERFDHPGGATTGAPLGQWRCHQGASTSPYVHGVYDKDNNDPNYVVKDADIGDYLIGRQDVSEPLMFHNKQEGNPTWLHDKFNRKVVKSVYCDEMIKVGYRKVPLNGWQGSTTVQGHDHDFEFDGTVSQAVSEIMEAAVEGDNLTQVDAPVYSLQGLSRWVGDEKRFRKEIRFPDGGLKVTYDAETDSWMPNCCNRNIYIALVTDQGINPLAYHELNGQAHERDHLHHANQNGNKGAIGLPFYAKTHYNLNMKINYRDF